MTGFKYNGQLKGQQSPGTLDLIIANSATIKIGDAVKAVNGFITPATAGDKVLGIVMGISTKEGLPLDAKNVRSGRDYDGTYTRGGIGTGQYVATSDNVTDKKVKAVICIDKDATFVNDSAGVLSGAEMFKFFNLSNSQTVAAFVAGEVAGSFQLVGLDPDNDGDTSKGLFIIAESQIGSYVVS